MEQSEADETQDSEDLTDTILRLVRLWVPARSVAFFEFGPAGVRLALAFCIDQGTLWDAEMLASRPPLGLREGAAFRGRGHGGRSFLVLPCLDHEGGPLRGVLYVELPEGVEARPLRPLRALAEMLAAQLSTEARAARSPRASARAERRPAPEPAPAPEPLPDEPQLANLVFLLEHNEWNVSRVARLLGVTRMTVYNRLRRAGIGRKRVAKKAP